MLFSVSAFGTALSKLDVKVKYHCSTLVRRVDSNTSNETLTNSVTPVSSSSVNGPWACSTFST